MAIPIRNLYYLFCYAWARFPEGDAVDVGIDEAPDLPNLLAKVLVNGANRLIRRGLDRGYRQFIEGARAPRGRMMLDLIVKEQALRRGMVICAFDELTPDVPHNQIIKATARSMSRAAGIECEHAHELGLLVQRMGQVSDIRLSAPMFKRVQLSRNTGQYLPILKLCEIVFHAMLPEEGGRQSRFADILKDEVIMSAVFEDFLRNFYAHEQRQFQVGREVMTWDACSLEGDGQIQLPIMETDLTLRSRERTIVMDAKYYKEALSSRHGPGKVRSSHLYQLFAYLEHAALRAPHLPCDGALIYPTVGEALALRYKIRGHEVMIRTVNLDQPWWRIHDELLAIPKGFGVNAAVGERRTLERNHRARPESVI
jgi:5-methylcytosine-specific restriction enzyme subunit McrC